MSDILQKEWKSALTSILEELDKPQYLKMLEYLTKIPKSKRTSDRREKMAQKIIEHYGVRESISVISDIMEEIPRRDADVQDLLRPFVDELRNNNKGNEGIKRKLDPAEDESSAAGEKKKKSDPAEEDESPVAAQQKSGAPEKERNNGPWRKSIRDLKSIQELCDTDGFFGKVVQKSGLRTYYTKDKEKKFFFYLGVADETASIKVMVYGKERNKEIKEEKSYLFRKLIKDEYGFKVNQRSRVSETNSVEVPEEIEMEAQKLIYPESPFYSINEATSLTDGTGVSVEGTVTEVDAVLMLKQTKRQHFQLKDETGSISVCMWRDKTEQCKGLSVGDVVKVANVKTSYYFKTVSLNSTGFTRIHKVQSVGVQEMKIEIIGIIKAVKKETHLEAEVEFNKEVHTFVVASKLLAKAFNLKLEKDFKQSLLDKIPFSANAEIHGSRIKKITAKINLNKDANI
ncbi:uncharacterized protein LOC127360497 isoform X2 [Dicentrarchus labrax]|uniref:uncharacterized protein LOC127360497 isoform X2 n=1 Tax=Dicentrarchus labrax TaxID=13489 RepID=UPI0021F61585|nr:uncharacterized protein LOC127360497 isoform X2 [Dicentrarchus labrax]